MESFVFVLGLASSFIFALALAKASLESIVRLARLGVDVNRRAFNRRTRGSARDALDAAGPIAA